MLEEAENVLTNREDYLFVDTRSWEEYVRGHIPGAVWLNVYDFILEATDQQGIQKLTEHLGQSFAPLTPYANKRIVFYENISGMRAARGLWFFQFAGNDNGAVLNGGLQAWIKTGGAIQQETQTPSETLSTFNITVNSSLLATYKDVLARLNTADTVIVDSRGLSEYEGLTVDPCCTVKGRIPGAIHLNWEMLINREGKFLPTHEIKNMAQNQGITEDREVIVYCHRGARSANTALALRSAGFSRVRNYIGSWHEWTRQPGAPIEK